MTKSKDKKLKDGFSISNEVAEILLKKSTELGVSRSAIVEHLVRAAHGLTLNNSSKVLMDKYQISNTSK